MKHIMTTAALLLGLSACNTAPERDPYSLLLPFDPDYTTVRLEAARASAATAPDTLVMSPGEYCMAFSLPAGKSLIAGREELTFTEEGNYIYATRYALDDVVRSHLEQGIYAVKGHLLTLSSANGTVRTIALTRTTATGVYPFGELPLERDSCTGKILEGPALDAALQAADTEQSGEYPWLTQ